MCGTPGYVAPEILRGTGYSYNSDIFSLGSLFFTIVTGRYLFGGDNYLDILKLNRTCNLSTISSHLKEISSSARDLLLLMLSPDPKKRPTARQALTHHWFRGDQVYLTNLIDVNDSLCNKMMLSKSGFLSNQSFSSFQVGLSCFRVASALNNINKSRKRT